ncbi:hypothetical protein Pcinc_026757 [Petrolisthes cinctipes]|uniref:Probable Ufm1-specific protease 2 n=1 Tax=Petrolisthes cinctipes TaxID=88211 RepID=A0AAE1F6D0_PETCI|nr:hypothetical protein Pcinc_026757 [Petrolisthes cinctipes]
MDTRLTILSQLAQRVRGEQEPSNGSVYGIRTRRSRVLAVAVITEAGNPGHDASLLLPVPLVRVGSFTVCKGDHTTPTLKEGEVAIVWDQLELHTYSGGPQDATPIKYTITTEEEFSNTFLLAKVSFSLDISAKDSTSSIRNMVQSLTEQLESSAACFRLLYSKLVLQNNKGILSLGKPLSDSNEPVTSLIKSGTGNKKSSTPPMASFQFMFSRSVCPATNAPVVRIDKRKTSILSALLNGEVFVYLRKAMAVSDVANLLSQGMVRQLHLSEHWLGKQLADTKLKGSLTPVNSLHFIAGHVVSVIYPDETEESYLEEYRKEVHKALLLPLNRPMVKRGNKQTLNPASTKSSVLTNTHVGLSSSNVNGIVRIVQGTYGYHHYMQDHFDDNKWGCAYRSLQTLVSWFKYQGYTDKPIPTHREIQKCLADIGDKPSSFIGSKQWIGSTEVGYVLDNMFNVGSRFIYVSSGEELASYGRQLTMHFEIQGTPIMIGGGVLAHTIIGVDWSDETGDINFLILDPHYTGSEDLGVIQSKGWCGWKSLKFWKPGAYYNLCLPQRPHCV